MIHSQNEKVVAEIPSSTTASSGTATLTIDTAGYDHASVSVLRASNAATTFATVCKVEESDDNSSYSNVTALVGGGTGGFSIPAVSATSSVAILKLDIDTKAKKRYLKISVTPSTAVNVAIVGRLSRAAVSPASASEAGVIGIVNG
jgi:hypothetical protein